MNADNAALLDEFCDAVWLEDGLAKNTLESYRRDLTLFAGWHERQGRASLRARFTVDVSDTVPVLIGEPSTWNEY